MTSPRVCALATTPVKGTALHFPESVELTADGVVTNRSFYLVDDRGRMVNGKRHGTLVALRADYQPDADRLTLEFPDGTEVAAPVSRLDQRVETNFYGRPVAGRVLGGPWTEALSDYLDAPVRLVASERSGDAVDVAIKSEVAAGEGVSPVFGTSGPITATTYAAVGVSACNMLVSEAS